MRGDIDMSTDYLKLKTSMGRSETLYIEELYQAFKERIINEIVVQSDELLNCADLVENIIFDDLDNAKTN